MKFKHKTIENRVINAWQWNPKDQKIWINVEDEILKLAANDLLTINENKDGCAVLHLESGDEKLDPGDYIVVINNDKLAKVKKEQLETYYEEIND